MNLLLFLSRLCGQSSFSHLNNGAICKALASSNALTADNNNSENGVNKTTSQWAFDTIKSTTSQMADWLYYASPSWFVLGVISRMQDVGIQPMNIRSNTIGSHQQIMGNRKTKCDAMETRTKSEVSDYRTHHVQARRMTVQPDLVEESTYPSVTQAFPWLYGKNKSLEQVSKSNNISSIKEATTSTQPTLRRVDSKEWIKDYKNKKERIDKINFNNIFGGTCEVDNNQIPALPPLNSYEASSPKYSPVADNAPSSPSSVSTKNSILSATEPTPADVICGRGGKANSHCGNISFRAEALKLRSWYESSSKSEKFTISNLLVDFVKERGGRFLKRDAGREGGWVECDGNDVRKKASQALREGKLKDLGKG